jgi:hypothetical protein
MQGGIGAVTSRILRGNNVSRVAWRLAHKEVAVLVCATVLACLPACKTSEPSSTSRTRPGTGTEEYQKLVTESETAVLEALHWLDQAAAQTNLCPPKLVSRFSRQVEQLQSESLRVRARAQAIQTRGDAYFEAWAQELRSAPSAEAAQNAARTRVMQQAFVKIKEASQQTGEAFRPFLSGLRKLRAQLETNPGVVEQNETRELIRTTREHGVRTVESLRGITAELQVLTRLLQPDKAVANL